MAGVNGNVNGNVNVNGNANVPTVNLTLGDLMGPNGNGNANVPTVNVNLRALMGNNANAAPRNTAERWNIPPSEVAEFVPRRGASNGNAPPAVAAADAAAERAEASRGKFLNSLKLSLTKVQKATEEGVEPNSDEEDENALIEQIKALEALAPRRRQPPGSYADPNLRKKPTAGTPGKAAASGPYAGAGTGSTMSPYKKGGSRRKSRKTRGRRSNKNRKSRRRR
jgi:hypothetical protein